MNGMLTVAVNTTQMLSDAGMTVLIGLVVVFSALLLLTIVFWLFGVAARSGNSNDEKTALPKAPVTNIPVAKAAPVIEDGVPEEVVAVIAAAVAAMSDGTTTYSIRRIRPVARMSSRPVWAAAGIADNTRPF